MGAKTIRCQESSFLLMKEMRDRQREELEEYRHESRLRRLEDNRSSFKEFVVINEFRQQYKECDWMANVQGEWPEDVISPVSSPLEPFGASLSPSPCPSTMSSSSRASSVCSLDTLMSSELPTRAFTDLRREYQKGQQKSRINIRRSVKSHTSKPSNSRAKAINLPSRDSKKLKSDFQHMISLLGDQQYNTQNISNIIHQNTQLILDALTLDDYHVDVLNLLTKLSKLNLIEPQTLMLLLQSGLIFSLGRADILESKISFEYTIELLLNISTNVPTLLPYMIDLMVSSNFTLTLEQKIFFGSTNEVEMILNLYCQIMEILMANISSHPSQPQIEPMIPPVLMSDHSLESYSFLATINKLVQSGFISSLVPRGLQISMREANLWETSFKLATYLIYLAHHQASQLLDKSSITWVENIMNAFDASDLDASLIGSIMKLEAQLQLGGQSVVKKLEQAKLLQGYYLQFRASLPPKFCIDEAICQ